jgi:hypothetical protein
MAIVAAQREDGSTHGDVRQARYGFATGRPHWNFLAYLR